MGKDDEGRMAVFALPPMEEKDCAPFKIFYWNVPRYRVGEDNIFTSHYADSDLLKFVSSGDPSSVQSTIRDFVPEIDKGELQRHRDFHDREPDGFIYGVKIQGRFTTIAWDPSNPYGKRWDLKFAALMDNPDRGPGAQMRNLGKLTIQRSIMMSAIFEEILRNEGTHSRVGFFPERFGVFFGEYGYIAREQNFVGFDYKPKRAYAVPLHAFLSSDHFIAAMVLQAFSKGKIHPQPWKNWMESEFIPKLAAFFIQLQLCLGIVPELHTQNTKIILELTEDGGFTGSILGFAFTDAPDAALDPAARIMSGRYSYLQELSQMRSPNIMNQKVMGETEMGEHFHSIRGFLSQSIGASFYLSRSDSELENPEDWEAQLYQKFLHQYLNLAQQWMKSRGHGLSPEIQAFSARMNRGLIVDGPPQPVPIRQFGPEGKTLYMTKGHSAMNLIALLASMIAREQVQVVLMGKIQEKLVRNTGSKKARTSLRAEFDALVKAKRIAFIVPKISEDFEVTWAKDSQLQLIKLNEFGIVAYRMVKAPHGHVPVAVAIAPLASEKQDIITCSAQLVEEGASVLWHNPRVDETRHGFELMKKYGSDETGLMMHLIFERLGRIGR